MTDIFIVTVISVDENESRRIVVMTGPTGQVETGTVYVQHLTESLEEHCVRRIRELFNVGLCHGWRLVYTSPADISDNVVRRPIGTTQVFEFDFDTLSGAGAGRTLDTI